MKKIFLVGALALSLAGQAQKVTVKPTFTKGQKLELVTKANTVMSMEMMGQSMENKIDATITRSFDVENASESGTNLEHKIKRLQMSFSSPMGAQNFDSENEADMKGEGGKSAEKALKNKYTLTLDGNGKITNVKLDDQNSNTEESSGMLSGAMDQLGGGGAVPKVGTSTELTLLPAEGVAKGDTWADTAKGQKSNYTVSDITGDEVIVKFTSEGKTERKQEAQGMEIVINSVDKTSGTIRIDRKTGIMKERVSTTDSEGTMEVMGQSVPMTTKTQVTTTVTTK
ncbi:DUF6263 family protein [Flaviaesturariibacter amylovorans]|uniref:Uncharacterized protein n=1 Tax=Flaviaesturariibacter amylovorans TaxID=1084520 RepID=A0ABP8HTK9_9BACT